MTTYADRRDVDARRVRLATWGYSSAGSPFVVTLSRGSRVRSAACAGSRIARWICRTLRTPRISMAYFSTAASRMRPWGWSTASLHAIRSAFVERNVSRVIILLSRCIGRLPVVRASNCRRLRTDSSGDYDESGAVHAVGTNDPITVNGNYPKRESAPNVRASVLTLLRDLLEWYESSYFITSLLMPQGKRQVRCTLVRQGPCQRAPSHLLEVS